MLPACCCQWPTMLARARMIFSSGQDGEVPSGCLMCLALHGQLVKWTASPSPKPVTSQVPRQAVYH